jgi:hypothetical protein
LLSVLGLRRIIFFIMMEDAFVIAFAPKGSLQSSEKERKGRARAALGQFLRAGQLSAPK